MFTKSLTLIINLQDTLAFEFRNYILQIDYKVFDMQSGYCVALEILLSVLWCPMGRKSKKEGIYIICIRIADSLCYTAETNCIVKQLYSNKNSLKNKNKIAEWGSLIVTHFILNTNMFPRRKHISYNAHNLRDLNCINES